MDNQPTQPGAPSPEMPTNSNPVQPTTPPMPATEAPTPPTGLPPTGDVVLESGKKKKKGLIATIIAIVAVLLIGGGAFAAAYIVSNQPANIIASSLNNLLNANQVEVDGTINLTIEDSEAIGVESFSLNFDDKASGISNATTASLNINFTNGASAPAIEFGEVLLSDGVLYIEANNLQEFYDEAFRDNIKETLMEQALYGYQTNTVDCYSVDDEEEYTNCIEEAYSAIEVDPATKEATSDAIDKILDQIGEIIETIDGQWIEVSIDDVLNNEMFANMDSSSRQAISDSYKCTINTFNQFSNYSKEYSDLYSQNPFINMTAGNDSFYNISFDANYLTNYLNAMPSTKFVSDLATCYNTTVSSDNVKIEQDEVNELLQYVPQISAKFDGLFDHHLTELKMSEQNDYYTLDTDLKFSYPNNIVVNAPADSRPIMEVIEEISQDMEVLQDLYSL